MRWLTFGIPKKATATILEKYYQGVFLTLLISCALFSLPAYAAENKDDDTQPQASVSTPTSNNEFLFSGSVNPERSTLETSSKRTPKTGKHPLRFRHATLNLDRLKHLTTDGLNNRLVLNLFSDTVLVAIKDRVERNASGSQAWIGQVEGVKHSSVIVIVRDKTMVAKVAMPGTVYKITLESGDTHVIEQLDQADLIDHPGEPPEIYAEPSQGRAADSARDIQADDGSAIDVLVVYTPEARAAAGGVAAIESTIELGVVETNLAYESSNVGQRIDLVHMYESPDAQLPDNPSDPDDSAFETNLVGIRLKSDGYLDGVHTLRDEFHADFVHLIITDPAYCGLAYVQSSPADSGFEDWAFGVTDESCVVGNYSFTHELGHNMGLHHDWYVNQSLSPRTWAHGFTNPPDGWRTVMAYNTHCDVLGGYCTRLGYFSNPGNSLGGDPMGVAAGTAANCKVGQLSPDPNSCDADGHTMLNSNASSNSQFRSSEITWLGYSSDWNDLSNWTMDEGPYYSITAVSRVPRSIDDIRIPSSPAGGSFPAIGTGIRNVRNVVIESGATLTMSGGTLNVRGSWEERGIGSFNGNGGTVVFKGSFDQTIQASNDSVFPNVTIGDGASSQAVNLLSNLDVNGDFTLLSGTSFSAGTHTIEVAGNWDDQAGGFSPGGSTVIFDGSTQTVDKVGSTVLMNEDFSEGDGAGCGCWSGYLPGGWVREHSTGSGFLGGEIGDSDGGAAVRWRNSTDAWLHSTGVELAPGVNYQVSFDYDTRHNYSINPYDTTSPQDFHIYLGTAQNSASMTTLLHSVIGVTSTATQNASTTFTVPTAGIYYLGLRAQQTGARYAIFDNVVLMGSQDITFNDIQIQSSMQVSFNQDVEVLNDLIIQTGGNMDIGTRNMTVEGVFFNNGTLKQTKSTPTGTKTEFLRIKNAAGSSDKYFGVEIAPSSGSMGTTTVAITATDNVDKVRRSYEITPGTSQTALTRFYYRDLDENGQLDPNVYHWNGSSWDDLGASATGGSGDSMYVETTTSEYSPFILSDEIPTRASIGEVSLEYVSVADMLADLSQGGKSANILSNLLASLNPSLADSLANAGVNSLLVALTRELDPDGDGFVAILTWATLEERGTIGFYAERQVLDKGWKRLNNDMLPGMIDAPMGAEYLLFDPEAGQLPEYLYRLIEVEAWGTKVEHGPWLLRLRQ